MVRAGSIQVIRGLMPYAAYKDSSEAWFNEVPAHWSLVPNRGVFKEVDDRGHEEEEMLSITIERGVMRQADLLRRSSKKDSSNLDKSSYKLVRPGDVTYNKMRAWQGAVGVSGLRGIVSPAYVVLRLMGIPNTRYFHYLFRTPMFAKEAERWSYGIASDMWSLRPEHFKNIYSCVPPVEEQSAIVRFLDYMDRRIRRYIGAKQKLIKLLEEQKQAIIHRAVTRGLDPNARVKPSGVEWLGDVPIHWSVTVAKAFARVFIPSRDKPELNEVDGLPWVTLENLGEEFVSTPRFYVNEQDARAAGSRSVPGGSVLASCVGRFGIASVTQGPAIINQQIQAFIPLADLSGPFLRYCVMAGKSYFEMEGNSTTLAYVDRRGFGSMPIAVPPMAEQRDIEAALMRSLKEIDGTMASVERGVSLVREYRTRLIADVVTGKLDVREAAAQLPDESDEPEPFEKPDALVDTEGSGAAGLDSELEEADA